MSESSRLESRILDAYRIIGRLTPIKADCGLLCGAACCKDADEAERATMRADEAVHTAMRAVDELTERAAMRADEAERAAIHATRATSPDPTSFLDPVTPLDPDESEAPDSLGMLLYPGEADLLSNVPGFHLYRILYMGRRVWFLVCEGTCDRRKRPLACRVFPLSPHIDADGGVGALPDPRAKRMCPLSGGEHIDPAFRRAVAKTFRHLARAPAIYDFMRMISDDLDGYRNMLL